MDLKRLGITWLNLLGKYAHTQEAQDSKDEIFGNLYSLGKGLMESNPDSTGWSYAENLMKALDLVYEKLNKTQPTDALWVKEKIEKFYGIKLSTPLVEETEKNCLQGFFSQSRMIQSKNHINPFEISNSLHSL